MGAYDKEAARLFAVIKDILRTKWDVDMNALYSNTALMAMSVVVAGFTLPFDEGKPITPYSEESIDFGSRLKLFSTLRQLFLHQTLFLTISIILAQAMEKNLVKAL